MSKTEAKKVDDDQNEGGEGEQPAAPKKRFGKKFLLMAGGGGLVLLLAVGAGGYFFFFSGSSSSTTKMANAPTVPLIAPQIVYYDMPDIVVNIQSADGSPAYLKLSVSLELDNAEEKPGIENRRPAWICGRGAVEGRAAAANQCRCCALSRARRAAQGNDCPIGEK
jgi:flagellar FliL protein